MNIVVDIFTHAWPKELLRKMSISVENSSMAAQIWIMEFFEKFLLKDLLLWNQDFPIPP